MIRIAFALALLISCAFADDCAQYNKSCDTCTAQTATLNCGWCAATQQCLTGNTAGPTGQGLVCYGSWEYGKCTPCESFPDCRTCNEYDSDCYWCAKTGICHKIGTFVGCTYTKSCPCDAFEKCDECLSNTDCVWCDGDGGSCQNSTQSCQYPPMFNSTSGCPCSINNDCGSCKTAAGCIWCEGQQLCKPVGSDPTCNSSYTCQHFCQTQGTTCDSCNDMNGCGWCSRESRCVYLGTYSGTCAIAHSCPKCNTHTYCDTCQADQGCAWCENTQSCQTPDTPGCLIAHTCDQFCSQFADCNSCNMMKGCGWCSESSSCVDAGNSLCLLTHGCTAPSTETCGFDAGSFVGGMFLIIGLLLFGVGGYLFYRWKTGRKISYTELK